MALRVADFVGRRRDSVEETKLAEALRAGPPEEAFAFIHEYLESDPIVGLMLANRVLRDRNHFAQILRAALINPDASTIRHYLEACIPRLGPERVLAIFEETVRSNPHAALKAHYYVRRLLIEADQSLRPRLDAIRATVEPSEP